MAYAYERQAHLQSLPLDPRLGPSAGVRLCTYHRWLSRREGKSSVTDWDVPMGNCRLHRIFRFRMGARHLPIQMGRHLRQPRSMRVYHMCHSGALCDERHILMECPALGDVRSQYAPLIAESSGIMAQTLYGQMISPLLASTSLILLVLIDLRSIRLFRPDIYMPVNLGDCAHE